MAGGNARDRVWHPTLPWGAGTHLPNGACISVVAHESPRRCSHEQNGRQAGFEPGASSPGSCPEYPPWRASGPHLDWKGETKCLHLPHQNKPGPYATNSELWAGGAAILICLLALPHGFIGTLHNSLDFTESCPLVHSVFYKYLYFLSKNRIYQ